MSNNDNNNNNQNVKRTSTDTSYTVFASVDARVAKPVLGSDGAAAWQNFRQQSSKAASSSSSRRSVAPKAPLKALDRAVGYTSWHQERQNEERVRAQDGERAVNAGYTHFAKKNNSSITEKERKRIQQRLIGEDQDYFLPFKTWQGPKWDYVFTTKQSHGTGYFFDGMDSLKRLLQEEEQQPVDSKGAEAAASSSATASTPTGPLDKPIKKQKSATSPVTTQSDGKKRKKTKAATNNTVIIQSDPTNPLQQVAAVLQARQQQHQQQNAWEQAVDSASGKPYYYNRVTGQRSWEPPLPTGWHQASDPETGKPYYFHKDTGVVVWERPS